MFHFDDWFEYTIGPPVMDLTAAPYGDARYSVETHMDGRIFARFHLDAAVGDVVIEPLEPPSAMTGSGLQESRRHVYG